MKYISLEFYARFRNFHLERKRECATAEYLWRTTVYIEWERDRKRDRRD